uniref:Putative secreted protein n=1 Tax=Anopheles triannulatus TaxID=58253 RepID=A0A2M4B267_9DIPT
MAIAGALLSLQVITLALPTRKAAFHRVFRQPHAAGAVGHYIGGRSNSSSSRPPKPASQQQQQHLVVAPSEV